MPFGSNVNVESCPAPVGDNDHLLRILFRNDKSVADQAGAGRHLGFDLGPKSVHGSRREKCVYEVVADKRVGPEITVVDVEVGEAACAQPGPGPGQGRMFETDESAVRPDAGQMA